MKTNLIRAEVFNLEGMKVHICRDLSNMDFSKLLDDVYVICYKDSSGETLWTEKYIKSQKPEYVYKF